MAASDSFNFFPRVVIFGTPYFGLIVWQPSSQKTPSAAVWAFGHGRVLGEVTVGLQFFLYFFNHLLVLLGREPFLAQQVFLKAVNGIALAPELQHLLGHIRSGIVDGMAFHAHQLGLDQRSGLHRDGHAPRLRR